jgi:hypothetical protein
LVGAYRSLAVLDGGVPLLARATTDRGGAFFCTTTTSPGDSSLASAGVVLYAMIQRAGEAGAMTLASTTQAVAGDVANRDTQQWEQLAGSTDGLSSTYSSTAGIYQNQDKLVAVNRTAGEDVATIVPEERVELLFANLDFDRVNQIAGNSSSLIQEVWRLFLILVLIAMILEALLCIPRRVVANPVGSSFSMGAETGGPATRGFGSTTSDAATEDVPVGGVL